MRTIQTPKMKILNTPQSYEQVGLAKRTAPSTLQEVDSYRTADAVVREVNSALYKARFAAEKIAALDGGQFDMNPKPGISAARDQEAAGWEHEFSLTSGVVTLAKGEPKGTLLFPEFQSFEVNRRGQFSPEAKQQATYLYERTKQGEKLTVRDAFSDSECLHHHFILQTNQNDGTLTLTEYERPS